MQELKAAHVQKKKCFSCSVSVTFSSGIRKLPRMCRTPTTPELQAQKSRAATRLFQQLVKHCGAIMNMTATPGNTPSVATLFVSNEKVSQHKMSSREIAELTGKRHDNVKRTIDSLVVDRVIDFPQIEENPASLGRPGRHYLIGKRDSFVVVAQLSPQFTAALVDRWQELESALIGRIQVPKSFSEALRLAADQAEQNQQLQQVIQQQAPKVQALDRLSATHGSICITSAAKQLGVGPLALFKWLSDNRWIYRRTSFASWSAYQPRLTSGLLEHKLVRVGNGAEEDLKVVEQVMVTRKGITHLATVLQEAL